MHVYSLAICISFESKNEIMKTVETIEDLALWHVGRLLSKEIFQLAKVGELADDEILSKQCKMTAIQMMNRITEYECLSLKKAQLQHLKLILKSGVDLRSLMTTLYDIGYLTATMYQEVRRLILLLLEQIHEEQAILNRQVNLGLLAIQF